MVALFSISSYRPRSSSELILSDNCRSFLVRRREQVICRSLRASGLIYAVSGWRAAYFAEPERCVLAKNAIHRILVLLQQRFPPVY